MNEIEKEIKEISSILDKAGNKRIFVPDEDYYAAMQNSVMSKISHMQGKGRIIDMVRISAVAASIVLLIGIFILIDGNRKTENELSMTAVYDYLFDNAYKIDDEMIYSMVGDDMFDPGAFIFDDQLDAEGYFEDNPEILDLLDIEYFY